MARFLGTAAGRTMGAPTGASGFTKAKVFSGAGTTSFVVPQDVTKLKVFVVGAGSSYRTGTYCFNSSNCCSGVAYPSTCYVACFTGHLTGAGGGYAEKTFIQSTDFIAGKSLSINVGSIGGLSASSVSGSGISTVTASNATESAYSWSCTNNSTARDNSNDNPISIGIQLPVCGYQNNFSGYYNRGGTASGGDVNRTGGRGILIPEFITDSYFDGLSSSVTFSQSSTNASSCWINPIIQYACGGQYHTSFGFVGQYFGNYICEVLCGGISNLCYGTSAGTQNVSSRYTFIGNNTKGSASCATFGAENTLSGLSNPAANQFIKNVPIGVGAQAGNSSANGKNGYSDLALTQSTVSSSISGGGSAYTVNYSRYTGSYDFWFGGTRYSCTCEIYNPGCYSVGACRACGGSQTMCYVDTGPINYGGWTCEAYYIGHQFPYGLASSSGGNGTLCSNRTHNLGFINDENANFPPTEYTINLSMLTNENGTNIEDIVYGRGAGISTSASFGGGGNRLYPNGGSGLVVLIY